MSRATDTQARLVDALEEVLRENGPAGATLEAVAQRAGVSKGGLLYHFPTKEALYASLLDRLRSVARREAEEGVTDPGGAVLAYLTGSTQTSGAFTRTLMASLALLGTSDEATAAVREALSAWEPSLREATGDPVRARLIQLVGDGLYLGALCGRAPDETDRAVMEIVARG